MYACIYTCIHVYIYFVGVRRLARAGESQADAAVSRLERELCHQLHHCHLVVYPFLTGLSLSRSLSLSCSRPLSLSLSPSLALALALSRSCSPVSPLSLNLSLYSLSPLPTSLYFFLVLSLSLSPSPSLFPSLFPLSLNPQVFSSLPNLKKFVLSKYCVLSLSLLDQDLHQ